MDEIFACSLDLGTMNLSTIRDDGRGGLISTQVRNCYRELPYAEEFEDQMRLNGAHFLRDGDKLFVLGNEALVQARMAEVGVDFGPNSKDMLQRPMMDGVVNPNSPKTALMILRELQKVVVEAGVGPARPGEILYYSIPADPLDSTINNIFHSKMAEKHLRGLGFDARPLGEGHSVILAENPKMHSKEGDVPFTGIGISIGAGCFNFCLAERGTPIDEWSLCRAGDWIDSNASRMCCQPKTKILRVKELELNFNTVDNISEKHKNYDVLLALDCYYDEMIGYAFKMFASRFQDNRGSIDSPIDIVIAGGTASVPGFDKKVLKVLAKMSLPFEIGEVRLAGGGDTQKMLKAVSYGCYLRAKQAAKKAMAAREAAGKPVPVSAPALP